MKKNGAKKYRLIITQEDMRDKKYRKYLYPEIVDGVTYEDDTEKKLSESSWFRCLPPKRQVSVEKEMRLRANGAFHQKVLIYPDRDADPAPAIPKPVIERMCETLSPALLRFFMSLIPYIHPNDGLLRNNSSEILLTGDFLQMARINSVACLRDYLSTLEEKRLILVLHDELPTPKSKQGDLFLDLAAIKDMGDAMLREYSKTRRVAVYVNPFVVFLGQYIDSFTVPFFKNSGWYVINPYATRIDIWIDKNCK